MAKPRLSVLVVLGAASLIVHCAEEAFDDETAGANADGNCVCTVSAQPPEFVKLQEGVLAPTTAEVVYETEPVDVSGYRELALHIDNPPWGDTTEFIPYIVPAFAHSVYETFYHAAAPTPTGGRIVVNGGAMRLRYYVLYTGAQVSYAIYGVR